MKDSTMQIDEVWRYHTGLYENSCSCPCTHGVEGSYINKQNPLKRGSWAWALAKQSLMLVVKQYQWCLSFIKSMSWWEIKLSFN